MDIFIRILKGFALGLVQGLTEFLPVSSSGHLLLLENLGVAPPSVATNLFLHVATLIAVLVTLRKPVFEIIKHPFGKKTLRIVVATIPTAIIGIIFKIYFEDILLGKYLPVGFLLTAILLLTVTPTRVKMNRNLSAFIVGISQGLAVTPGLSRSGTTISFMTALNYSPDESAELSFLMSIPMIIGGAVLELGGLDFNSIDWVMLSSAFVTALISGFLSIKIMLNGWNNARIPFAVYLLFLTAFSILSPVIS